MKTKYAWLAPLSGALWVLCFPKPDLGWLAWAALAPLFVRLAAEERPLKAAWAAFAAGLVFHLGLMRWIYETCRFAGLGPPVAAAAWVGLALAMSAHWALFGAGVSGLRGLYGPVPAPLWGVVWVGVEWLAVRWTTRFPWGLAGYTQWSNDWLLPSAGMFGVYGLSFLVVTVNAAVAKAAVEGRKAAAAAGWTAALVAGFFALGLAAGPRGEAPPANMRVLILQGNVDQYKKWDEAFEAEILDAYAGLAEDAKTAALVVWPESAVPGWLEDKPKFDWLSRLVAKTDTFHLVGVVSRAGKSAHNSAALFGPEGQLLGLYHKRQLVPFGEQIPDWLRRLPLAGSLAPLNALGAFTPGPPDPPRLAVFWGELAVGVCYEAIFPHLARHPGTEGARLLVNLTNDGWYLDTAGPYQHFAMSVVRAAENRAYLLRAANTGISALVDPFGRVAAKTRIGERTALEAKISMDLAHAAPSFYARFGDLFPALCLAATLTLIPLGLVERRAARRAAETAV